MIFLVEVGAVLEWKIKLILSLSISPGSKSLVVHSISSQAGYKDGEDGSVFLYVFNLSSNICFHIVHV